MKICLGDEIGRHEGLFAIKALGCTLRKEGCRTSLIKQFDKMDRFPDLLQQMERTLLTEMTYGKCTDTENSL